MHYQERIESLLESFTRLFYVGTCNHGLTLRKCLETAACQSMQVYGYNISQGLWQPKEEKIKNGDIDPLEMLTRILDSHRDPITARIVYLLEHFDLLLENNDPLLLTKLRLINDHGSNQISVILLGRPHFPLPDIVGDIPRVHVPISDPEDIFQLLKTCHPGLAENGMKRLAETLTGLTTLECENLLSLSLVKRKKIDIPFMAREKAVLLHEKARGLMELCEPEGDLSRVGGMTLLKQWLARREKYFLGNGSGAKGRLPSPKGVILTGPPGCGKSFLASALAGSWKVNLIKLDPSRLFSSLVGETEQRFFTMLDIVKSLAPAVLWIDEFEKFFPHVTSGTSDGGVLFRVLGLFLDFLQSAREGIFVYATTNNMIALPREIIRAGRFDAAFFVDLPNREERAAILKLVIKKYRLEKAVAESDTLINLTENFSGAEIENAVIETLYDEGGLVKTINDFSLIRSIKRVIPLATTMKEEISAMREWCSLRVRPASCPQSQPKNEGRVLCRMSPGSKPN